MTEKMVKKNCLIWNKALSLKIKTLLTTQTIEESMLRTLLFSILLLTQTLGADLFRRIEEFDVNVPIYACRTVGYDTDDINLINRIISAYQLAKKEHLGSSMWQLFFDQRQKHIHDKFLSGKFDPCAYVLRNPATNDLFYGFDNLCTSIPNQFTRNNLIGTATVNLDLLVRFGEAISAIKLDSPETYRLGLPVRKWYSQPVLHQIQQKLGTLIDFPNPYADEVGLWTPNGVATIRAVFALYQAYLIKQNLKGIENPKVLEIGAGLGRTAYFARLLGIKDYTIIDIPMTNLSQAYFLGKVLGEDQVALLGETADPEQIKILTPDQFLNNQEQHYDLIINVDSLTEMNEATMHAYIKKISESCPLFISINHEWNKHTVADITSLCKNLRTSARMPHWMRIGYVEEVYHFQQ